jgi:hypothetical protein
VTQAGLEAQLKLQLRMMAGMKVSYAEFAKLQLLRATTEDSTLAAKLRALADSGFGPANRDLTRHLEDMESGDIDPTPSDIAVVDADCRAIDSALRRLAADSVSTRGPACDR